MDLRFTELMQSAKLIVEDLAMVKEGDEALVITDTRINEFYGTGELVKAIVAAISAVGAEPVIVTYLPRKRDGGELPKLVKDAMKNAKIIFTITTYSILQTLAFSNALDNGARIMVLSCGSHLGKNNDMLYRLLPKTRAEVEELADLTKKIGERFAKGHKVKIRTEKGTDITMEIGGLRNYINTGFLDNQGMCGFAPTGQNCTGVIPGTANGKVVVDASISVLKQPLQEPIYMTFKDGMLIDIRGGVEAQQYKKLIEAENDPKVYNLAEVGTGNNPRAIISANALEDERYYGSAHIAIGSNASFGGDIRCEWHSDAIFYDATIEIDGEIIMENGKFLI